MKFINIGGLRHSYKNFLKKVVTAGNSEEPAILAADSTVNPTKVVIAMCKNENPNSCVIQVVNIKENKNTTITDSGIIKQTGDTAGKETEVFNTAGGTTDLSPVIKKVKYIKKERRNFFHKSIPISFYIDEGGNYNPQINGRYEDWYYSKCPVFKIAKGKKFRLFIGFEGNIENFREVDINSLIYWNPIFSRRINLIEKSGDALICNKSNNNSPYSEREVALICPVINDDIFPNDIVGYKIAKVIYNIDTYLIYIEWSRTTHPQPYDKRLKWVGNKIECICPTTTSDIVALFYTDKANRIGIYDGSKGFSNSKLFLPKTSIKYYKILKTRGNSSDIKYKYVTRCINNTSRSIKLKIRTNIITGTYKRYKKQPSKFYIPSKCKDLALLMQYIKRMR